jgi:hypothetical protein
VNAQRKNKMKPNSTLKLVQPAQPEAQAETRSFTWQEIEKLLDRPIAFQRPLAAIGGGALAGLFLSQALYWSQRTSDADGWFYKKQEEWTEETALTRSEQETVRKHLRARGLIKERRAGLPARIYYQVQKLEVFQALEKQFAGFPQSSLRDSRNLERPIPANRSAGIPQSFKGTDTTTETTAETTSTSGTDDEVVSLRNDLIAAGVSPTRAKSLAAKHPQEMRRRLDFLHHSPKVTNRGGYLSARPNETYSPPPGYIAADRRRQADDNARAAQKQAADTEAEKAARRRAEQQLNDQLDAHFKSLPQEDRKEIDDQAARRCAPLVAAGANVAGALAAARRNIMRKELGIPTEDDE